MYPVQFLDDGLRAVIEFDELLLLIFQRFQFLQQTLVFVELVVQLRWFVWCRASQPEGVI